MGKPYSVEQGRKYIDWYDMIAKLRAIIKMYPKLPATYQDEDVDAGNTDSLQETYSKLVKDTRIVNKKVPVKVLKFIREVQSRAADWVTCACGNQCAIIPRGSGGDPDDSLLETLGSDFSCYIGELDCKEALKTLKEIEKRSVKVIRETLKEAEAEAHSEIKSARENIAYALKEINSFENEIVSIKKAFKKDYGYDLT